MGGNLGVGLVGLMIATGLVNDLVVGPITTSEFFAFFFLCLVWVCKGYTFVDFRERESFLMSKLN